MTHKIPANKAASMLKLLVHLEQVRKRQGDLLGELRGMCFRALALAQGKTTQYDYERFIQEREKQFWTAVREDKP